jgi:hypothetical protein
LLLFVGADPAICRSVADCRFLLRHDGKPLQA